jgi:hypothetical protein
LWSFAWSDGVVPCQLAPEVERRAERGLTLVVSEMALCETMAAAASEPEGSSPSA